ncbi:hypothetical protein ABEY41_03925 [Peribacillus butanolivorans]|uniref:hypothetical protein n=1 Tax=Peribacillus butanolivorans TaxID=421767 RepID=UPI003D270B3D
MADYNRFIVIGDRIRVTKGIEDVQITDKHFLKKANKQQVHMIKKDLFSTGNENFYLMNFESVGNTISPYYEDWNYWIVELEHNERSSNIKLALLLSTINLFSLFEKLGKNGMSNHTNGFHNFIADHTVRDNVKEISQADGIEIQEIYRLLQNFDKERDRYTYINKALSDYRNLQDIPRDSPFYILAMFAILEALLVHKSQSVPIGHQLRSKLSLLNNRFEHPIDFFEIFGNVSFKKVIDTLYKYRSDVAHGDFSDFNGELQLLVDSDNVSKIIHRILKATLKQAIKEPQLIEDLKNC